jgi:16S rRNA (adenine(1408)-N(1))-methyltransferase
VVEPPDNSTERHSKNSSLPTGEGIVIDIGTGDGLFVYQCAKKHPRTFYIGIDANPRPLEKVSEKIQRKAEKGGLPNVLFLQAAVEDLPVELNGVADEVHIHFPWGSLLRALVVGDEVVLGNLRRLCASEALLEVIIGLDAKRDRAELERLQVSQLSIAQVDSALVPRYLQAGFEITERGERLPEDWPDLQTSWARRLRGNTRRSLIYIIARAI